MKWHKISQYIISCDFCEEYFVYDGHRKKEEPKSSDYGVVRTQEDALKEKDPKQKRFKRKYGNE